MAEVTVGRTVLYVLSSQDAEQIIRRRTTGAAIAERIKTRVTDPETKNSISAWPLGAQAHIGNYTQAGDVVPLVIVRVWPHEFGQDAPGVNGQAFLDGNDTLWVTSAKEGTEPGTWHWPSRT